MSTTTRQPKGVPAGGQFAATGHAEPSVALTAEQKRQQDFLAESARPLTIRDIEGLQNAHGTYEPGQGYYQHMPKVFDAAMEKAAATPEGRKTLAQRAQAEELQAITGTPAREILGFHEEVGPHEPGSQPWRNLTQMYSESVWNTPIANVDFIDTRMRGATGAPARSELVNKRRAITAEIDALDVNEAAAALRKRFPSAAVIEATAGEEQATPCRLTDAHGTDLWRGDIEDLTELDALNLTPDKHYAGVNPLRTCTSPDDQAWIRRYDLDKMTELTAKDLL
ncbi:hypothetical protein [Arthrobacter sp. UYCo732]|uniref:hypothetical protein n=1 Tax=Arthrobacter sp. UYCo732 TaxID=3156336 RepID=UPI0033930B77